MRCVVCEKQLPETTNERARFCGVCSARLNGVAYKCDEPEYVLYRAAQKARYGPGPWHPARVDPEDRWPAWVARYGAKRQVAS